MTGREVRKFFAAVFVILALFDSCGSSSSKKASGSAEALRACVKAVDALKVTDDAYAATDSAVSDAQYDAVARRSLQLCGPENGITNGASAWIAQAETNGYAKVAGPKVLAALCKSSDPSGTTGLCPR